MKCRGTAMRSTHSRNSGSEMHSSSELISATGLPARLRDARFVSIGLMAGEYRRPDASQYYQVIAVHDFNSLELASFNFGGVKTSDTAGKFGTVQVANAHDI